ncbi:MAG: DUF1919 domain-containing protein [bacterium]
MQQDNIVKNRDKLVILNGETNIFDSLYHINEENYEVIAILTNNKFEQGYKINNIPILPVDSIKDLEVNSVFISSVKHRASIYEQIAKFNIKDLKVFYNIKMLDSNIYLKSIDYDKNRLINKEMSIINNQCFGANLYKKLDLNYKSPFCWMYFEDEDFIKLLENLDYYLSCPLTFKDDYNLAYPVGLLDDIKIYFNHSKSQKYARLKWEERLQRFNKDNFFVVMKLEKSDNSESLANRFVNLKIKNKLLVTNFDFENKDCLNLKYWRIITPEYQHFWEYTNSTTFYNFDFIEWFNNNR